VASCLDIAKKVLSCLEFAKKVLSCAEQIRERESETNTNHSCQGRKYIGNLSVCFMCEMNLRGKVSVGQNVLLLKVMRNSSFGCKTAPLVVFFG